MKRLSRLAYFLLCILLLLFSDAAIHAGRNAVSLWLTRVLPALFPFYVATTLLFAGGMFDAIARRFPRLCMPACFLLGAISGYPVGARLCALSGHDEWSAFCNLCSPGFLLGVVAIGMLEDAACALPLMLAHYGAALLAMAASRILSTPASGKRTREKQGSPSLPQAIGEGMLAMLRIGGCIVFFSVCAAIIMQMLRLGNGPAAGVYSLLEMTAGCQELAALSLPPRLKCACLAAVVTFGGLSVYMQTLGAAPGIRPLPYIISKLFQASLAFLLAYALMPILCPEACSALSPGVESMLENASVMASLLLAASTCMISVYLLALVMKKARRHADAGH